MHNTMTRVAKNTGIIAGFVKALKLNSGCFLPMVLFEFEGFLQHWSGVGSFWGHHVLPPPAGLWPWVSTRGLCSSGESISRDVHPQNPTAPLVGTRL